MKYDKMDNIDNIELFDQYINKELSFQEKDRFENRLKSDEGFSNDFKSYVVAVHCIQKEAEQDGLDFAHAMKSVSKEELRSIIGVKHNVLSLPEKPVTFAKITRMRLGWIASTAAVVIVAFGVCFDVQRSARFQVDDVLYETIDVTISDRGGGLVFDVDNVSERQLKEQLPKLELTYRKASDVADIYILGMNLTKVFLKLHDRESAVEILEDMKSRCGGNEDITNQCDMILKNIK